VSKLTRHDFSRFPAPAQPWNFTTSSATASRVSYRDAKGRLWPRPGTVIDFLRMVTTKAKFLINRFIAVRELKITGRRCAGLQPPR